MPFSQVQYSIILLFSRGQGTIFPWQSDGAYKAWALIRKNMACGQWREMDEEHVCAFVLQWIHCNDPAGSTPQDSVLMTLYLRSSSSPARRPVHINSFMLTSTFHNIFQKYLFTEPGRDSYHSSVLECYCSLTYF